MRMVYTYRPAGKNYVMAIVMWLIFGAVMAFVAGTSATVLRVALFFLGALACWFVAGIVFVNMWRWLGDTGQAYYRWRR